MSRITIALSLFAASVSASAAPTASDLYQAHCSACHGKNLEGAQYTPLKKDRWIYAQDSRGIARIVMYGIPGTDMAPYAEILPKADVQSIVDFVLARQAVPPDEPRALLILRYRPRL